MNLVVVESPTKARTIGRFLGKDYEIKASMGHVMDLPKSKLGVDVDDNFLPQYELMPDKKQVVKQLYGFAKKAEHIILATDPDREGEAIASHVRDVLGSNSKLRVQSSKFRRIVFHEITKEAIEDALAHPRDIDENLVNAQTSRRVLDRLVGYKLSPLLWQKVRRGLSAGRVQSVALRLVVEREKEIEQFKKVDYWTIIARLNKETEGTDFELIEINGEKIETSTSFTLYDGEYRVTQTVIDTGEKAQEIVEDIQKHGYVVSEVIQKETKRSPQPPYTTSTLQQDGARRLGLSGRRTMSLAQKLYEEGHITYHRTDSVAMADSAKSLIRAYVHKEFGAAYVAKSPRMYQTKQKLAQEAHEAIRPTKVNVSASVISQDLGGAYGKLYELIWRRAIASQMSDAIIESTTVYVDSQRQNEGKNSYRFKANGSVLIFDGFLKVNPQALQDTRLPQFTAWEKLNLVSVTPEQHQTPPPPRYNDASIIKTLEEKGIGRPSTYAAIISTLESRRYIERTDARFTPTPVGIAVNDFLVTNFSDIDDIPFTAEMEDELDNIAHGKKQWIPLMRAFYTPFEKKLEKVKKDAERVKIEVEEIDELCPTCGSKLVVRIGKFGKFISCSTFPTCDFSKPLVEETGLTCPKCLVNDRQEGKVIVKRTRKGRKFFGCSNYPNCDFAAWKLEDIQNFDPNKLQKKFAKKKDPKNKLP